MHGINVLVTFAGGLGVALVLGFIATRLKLSPIVGYLLAGIVVGPFTPGFVADRTIAEQFAEIGVILLLFGIGLRFHLRELLAVWNIAIPGALIQSTLSTGLMAVILHLMGWDWVSGIILGMAISVASTVVMALVLNERRDIHSPIGHIAFGWTVVEDILTVVILLLLPIIFTPVTGAGPSPLKVLGITGAKIVGLLVSVIILGQWVIPWTLGQIEKTRSKELFTLAVLVLAIGIAVGSSEIFGVSMALGAFLAGLAVGRSEFAARAAADAIPMRDAFAVLFFVSVGMLFNPRSLLSDPLLIGLVLVTVLVGKPLAALLTVRILGKPFSIALPVGAAFSQIGEFSFILGTVARNLGLINDSGWNAMIAVSIISISANPSLYSWARRISSKTATTVIHQLHTHTEKDPLRCILVGFGPVGQIVYKLLAERGMKISVIDLNLQTIRQLRDKGYSAFYGDILRPGTLEDAGIAAASVLILSADIEDAPEIIRQARSINPELRILARCTHLRSAAILRTAGADVIAAGEAEVGVAFTEAIASTDGIDSSTLLQQRNDTRKKLYDSKSFTPII
jgi:CPA2 family monovalent cation:H+ antiporter-2